MAEISYLYPTTQMDIPVERVLDAAKQCKSVLVLGFLPDGQFYCAATTSDGGTLLWWLEQFKLKLLTGEFR